ncbi:MAG: Rieske 2Fe-2S domain-containing protein [Clostridia bacterium]|nr:Rieske 2Fe-2S domain-containing protein [Clostridia bacterium]
MPLHPRLSHRNTLFDLSAPLAPETTRTFGAAPARLGSPPHLGYALHYNPAERSWDCPCHGSRFAENGALLDNPATDDLKR